MSKQVTVAQGNRYCQARMNAGQYNEALKTRPGAVTYLPGVSEDCLKKYELDINRPSNEVVALMADAYNSPELRQWYCANECPLGKYTREISEMPSERAFIRLRNSAEDMEEALDILCKIMDDGLISEDEKETIPQIREQFLKAKQRIDENLAALEKAEKSGRFV